MKLVEPSAFGKRLLEIFEDAGEKNPKSKIAEVLGVKPSAVTNYLQDRIPDADKLRQISNFTKCSIHWLITGEGEKYINVEKKVNLEETIREVVREIVREEISNRAEIPGKNLKNEKEKKNSISSSLKK